MYTLMKLRYTIIPSSSVMISHIILVFISNLCVLPQSTHSLNIMDAYSSASRFSDMLHETLQEAAREVSSFDLQASEMIGNFEYDWMSMLGIYKGIFPIVSDFFMNYYGRAEFQRGARILSQGLITIYEGFLSKKDTGVIYVRIKNLIDSVVKADLFKEGAINSLIKDLHNLIKDERSFRAVVQSLRRRSSDVEELLRFIITGKTKSPSSEPHAEL